MPLLLLLLLVGCNHQQEIVYYQIRPDGTCYVEGQQWDFAMQDRPTAVIGIRGTERDVVSEYVDPIGWGKIFLELPAVGAAVLGLLLMYKIAMKCLEEIPKLTTTMNTLFANINELLALLKTRKRNDS